jgi:hypothetical protein
MEVGVDLIAGMLAMGYAVAALFFYRFWSQTRDRLFAFFCASFLLLAVQRAVLPFVSAYEWRVALYALRLAAFALIVVAIGEKSRE